MYNYKKTFGMSELLVYQTFPDKEQAMRTAATLENNAIYVSIEENSNPLDSSIIGQQYGNAFLLKIPSISFTDADRILEEQIIINLDEVDKEYLLLSFTNEELIDVLKHKSDWGIYNYKLAERLLSDRNVVISKDEIELARENQLIENASPIGMNSFWIILAYLLIATAFCSYIAQFNIVIALTPLLFVIVFGYTLYFSKNTLSNGKRYPTYLNALRLHGIVFILSGIILVLVLFLISFGKSFISSPSIFNP
jgi:hypothetical protein